MAEDYSREVLRRTVAQICQMIGWQAINSTPLDILVHVLEKYILTLATHSHRYAEHYSRTDPNLDDLGLAFADVDVRLSELREYAKCVPPMPSVLGEPEFPLQKESHLNFLKPGSREVLTRPMHVHEHLPPMINSGERDATPPVADTVEVEIVQNGPTEMEEPDSSDQSVFKKPIDPVAPSPPNTKRLKIKRSDEDCHARELSSVMMTTSGFLSPAREGKLPEARTPIAIPDALPEKNKIEPVVARLPPIPKIRPPENRLEKKSKKHKTLNGKIEKSKKKDKLLKHLDGLFVPDTKIDRPNVHLMKNKLHNDNFENRPMEPISKKILTPPPLSSLFVPPVEIIKHIKQEIPDRIDVENGITDVISNPVENVVHSNLEMSDSTKPVNQFPLNITIKEEKLDTEKLTSQPDSAKLNIFRKISAKSKEEKIHENLCDKITDVGKNEKINHNSHHNTVFQVKNNSHSSDLFNKNKLLDLSNKSENNDLMVNTVEFDIAKKIKQEPPDDYPKDLSRPKLSIVPQNLLMETTIKEKKEKKRKERMAKEGDKKIMKLLQKERDKVRDVQNHSTPLNINSNLYPINRPPLLSNHPLIPGFIPPGKDLFTNPALRGLIPQDQSRLPNPFSLSAGNFDPNLSFYQFGPGLIPPVLRNPHLSVNHSFGQPPQMVKPHLSSLFRRPSLEVIPIDEEDDSRNKQKQEHISPSLSIKEKEKPNNNKIIVNNSFLPNNSIINTVKQSPPKANPIIPVPPVKPDITIELNMSSEKTIKLEPKREQIDETEIVAVIIRDKEKDRSEKKKDKLHKKDKKDREQKIKKKKDKKEKLKLKLERRKEKEELKERLRKEKKEKRREKEKAMLNSIGEGIVPKLTLKLGSSSPMLPPSSPDTMKKLNIKPIVKKDETPLPSNSHLSEPKLPNEHSSSPELARISALVTRPPKTPKISGKHSSGIKSEPSIEGNLNNSPPSHSSNTSPVRKTRPPSSYAKYKRIYFKPIPRRNSSDFDDPIINLGAEDNEPPEKIPNIPVGTHYYKDPQGNQVWICPACNKPDNGSPMIGCDSCDAWYHWVCVGILTDPGDSEDWYCGSCIAKRTAMMTAMSTGHSGKKRGRKPKAEKIKEGR